MPAGRAPASVTAGAGRPVATTLNEPAAPTVNVALFALVIPGALGPCPTAGVARHNPRRINEKKAACMDLGGRRRRGFKLHYSQCPTSIRVTGIYQRLKIRFRRRVIQLGAMETDPTARWTKTESTKIISMLLVRALGYLENHRHPRPFFTV